MEVETVAADDPRLAAYHQQCPSRLKAAAAAAAVAVAGQGSGEVALSAGLSGTEG